jgi:hypothetical protein
MLIVEDHIEKLLFFEWKVYLYHLGVLLFGFLKDLEPCMAAHDIACTLVPDDVLDESEAVEGVADGALLFLGTLAGIVGSGIEAAQGNTSTWPPFDFAILAIL